MKRARRARDDDAGGDAPLTRLAGFVSAASLALAGPAFASSVETTVADALVACVANTVAGRDWRELTKAGSPVPDDDGYATAGLGSLASVELPSDGRVVLSPSENQCTVAASQTDVETAWATSFRRLSQTQSEVTVDEGLASRFSQRYSKMRPFADRLGLRPAGDVRKRA